MKKIVKALRYFSISILAAVILVLVLDINFKSTGDVIETDTQAETLKTSYIYGNGLVSSLDSEGNERFYVSDHLGSGNVVLDDKGNVLEETSQYAFGEERDAGDTRFTYTGKEKDSSGLYYYGARYYDADSGRFLQPDPITGDVGNPQSLNRYAYVLNNPLIYIDPNGMENPPPQSEQQYGPPTPPDIAAKNNVLNTPTPRADNTMVDISQQSLSIVRTVISKYYSDMSAEFTIKLMRDLPANNLFIKLFIDEKPHPAKGSYDPSSYTMYISEYLFYEPGLINSVDETVVHEYAHALWDQKLTPQQKINFLNDFDYYMNYLAPERRKLAFQEIEGLYKENGALAESIESEFFTNVAESIIKKNTEPWPDIIKNHFRGIINDYYLDTDKYPEPE